MNEEEIIQQFVEMETDVLEHLVWTLKEEIKYIIEEELRGEFETFLCGMIKK